MIDISKIKALAAELRDPKQKWANLASDANRAANAIDSLLSELEAAKSENEGMMKALAECREAMPERDSCDAELMMAVGDPMNVPAYVKTITSTLRAELEAREADRRDAERYRLIRAYYTRVVFMREEGQEMDLWAVGEIGDAYEMQVLDQAVDAALAQRQGEEK